MARKLELGLDLPSHIPSKPACGKVVYLLRLDDQPDFSPRLHRKGAIHAWERVRYRLQGREPLHVVLQRLPASARSRGGNGIGDDHQDRFCCGRFDFIVVGADRVEYALLFAILTKEIHAAQGVRSLPVVGESLPDVMEEPGALCDFDVESQLGSQAGRQMGNLDRVIEHVLSVACPKAKATHRLDALVIQAGDVSPLGSPLTGVSDRASHLGLGRLIKLLDAAGMDPPVEHEIHERQAGRFAPNGIERRNDDRLRGFVDDQVHAGHLLERPYVAALSTDDATLHILARQLHYGGCGFRNVLDDIPLDHVQEHPLRLPLGFLQGVSFSQLGAFGQRVSKLRLDLTQKYLLCLILSQLRDALQLVMDHSSAALHSRTMLSKGALLGMEESFAFGQVFSAGLQCIVLQADPLFLLFEALLALTKLQVDPLLMLQHLLPGRQRSRVNGQFRFLLELLAQVFVLRPILKEPGPNNGCEEEAGKCCREAQGFQRELDSSGHFDSRQSIVRSGMPLSAVCTATIGLVLMQIVLTLACMGLVLIAAAEPTPHQVDALFKRVGSPGTPGCAVIVEQGGRTIFEHGYGMANLETGAPITPSTVFHVASLSKQVTGFAIQLLVDDGALRLDDDIRKFLPEMHDFGTKITIANLLHHTSGLRDQWDLATLSGWRLDDVITEDDLLSLLYRQTELNFAPGSRYSYCNSGYTLLGQIVAKVSGRSLRAFCDQRIFKPLGMASTHFHDDYTEVVPNRATSYEKRDGGGFSRAVLSFGNVGATSLFTTVEDFAKWMHNLAKPSVGTQDTLARMSATLPLSDGQPNSYACGFVVGSHRGNLVYDHSGADAGYRSFSVVFPEQDIGVACFANLSDVDVGKLAYQVADLYLKPKPVHSNTPERMTSRAMPPIRSGAYLFEPYRIGRFDASKGHVRMTFNDGKPIDLTADTDSVFRIHGIGTIEFVKRDSKYDCILRTSDGTAVGEPLADFDSSLEGYAGTYFSEELGLVYTVASRHGHESIAWLKNVADLEPLARDVFIANGRVFRFCRNSDGGIDQFEISTGRSFNIRLSRISLKVSDS